MKRSYQTGISSLGMDEVITEFVCDVCQKEPIESEYGICWDCMLVEEEELDWDYYQIEEREARQQDERIQDQ